MTHYPHIQGQCKACGFLYDLYYGLGCPACKIAEHQELMEFREKLCKAKAAVDAEQAELGDEAFDMLQGQRARITPDDYYRPSFRIPYRYAELEPMRTEDDWKEIRWLEEHVANAKEPVLRNIPALGPKEPRQ